MPKVTTPPAVGSVVVDQDGKFWITVNDLSLHSVGLVSADPNTDKGTVYKSWSEATNSANGKTLIRVSAPDITPPDPDDHTYLRLRPDTIGFSIPGRAGDYLQILHLSDDNDYTPPAWVEPDYWGAAPGTP